MIIELPKLKNVRLHSVTRKLNQKYWLRVNHPLHLELGQI